MNAPASSEGIGPVVVIADDEVHVVDVLGLLAESLGAQVVKAYNGEQALRAVREHRPQLVLANVMMPKLRGAEVCQRIKASQETASIPVVLISSLPTEDLPACDADAFLPKPFDVARAEECIRSYLAPGPGRAAR